jgi:TetR/AcrR family transcriptional regulator, cholesterol catabolism regulator
MSQAVKNNNSREAIYQAAALLFQEKGYAGTSMRELAQKVGLEASSLYSHIASKEELLSEICLTLANRFLEGIREIRNSNAGATDQLSEVIKLHVNMASGSIPSVTVFNDEWKHLSEPLRKDFLNMRKMYEQEVLNILEEGIASGEIRPLDSKIAMYSFLTALRWIHYWFKPGRIGKERLYLNLKVMLLDGLKNIEK